MLMTHTTQCEKRSEQEFWSPPVLIDRIAAGKARIFVAREDLLPGGTKQRAIIPYLTLLAKRGYKEFVYASPFCGFAQIALAFSADALGFKVRVFCEQNENKTYAKKAMSLGAHVTFSKTLSEAHEACRSYADERSDRYEIPLGFNDEPYIDFMTTALSEQFQILCEQLGAPPKRIWLPVGSGTLARIFAELVDPKASELICINVRVLDENDQRIAGLRLLPNVTLASCEERFSDHATASPPIPSNLNYDAKLWKHIVKFGQNGDLWWNVAR